MTKTVIGVILGKSLGVDYSPRVINRLQEEYHLGPFGRGNAEAAGLLYQQGKIQQIWLFMGKTSDYSEAAEMLRYITNHFPEIPESAFVIHEQATNTVEELRGVVSAMESMDINPEQILLVSAGFQLERVELILRNLLHGHRIGQYVAAETIVPSGFFTKDDERIRERETGKERIGRFLLRLDPDWRVFGFVLAILRKIGLS